jgi:hypothetical protein
MGDTVQIIDFIDRSIPKAVEHKNCIGFIEQKFGS